MKVLALDGFENACAIGGQITGLTDGYTGHARWLKMLRLAIADAKDSFRFLQELTEESWRRCAVMLLLPDLTTDRYLFDSASNPEELKSHFIKPVLQFVHPALNASDAEVLIEGHTGLAAALKRAPEILASKSSERLLILAVDSYIDHPSIHWLAANDRLKSAEMPAGLIPGEAAAILYLEPIKGSVSNRDATARIGHVALETAPVDDILSERDHGRAIAKCISTSLADKGEFTGDIYSDVNGEPWRSYEFGAAQSLAPQWFRNSRQIFPAVSLGDTGAVSATIATIIAARARTRGYARGEEALVVSQSDDGNVGAFLVS
jgi:3-oxoacyl-[acyl-carrier-protein] synthase-1